MTSPRKYSQQLTPLELRIMNVLWGVGPSNVQAVQEKLTGERLAYTTVQTMLNVLYRKGKVKRVLRGKAYHYQTVLSREKAVGYAVSDLVDRLFGGSVEALVMSLVKARRLDPVKLARLNDLIEQHQKREQEMKNGGRN